MKQSHSQISLRTSKLQYSEIGRPGAVGVIIPKTLGNSVLRHRFKRQTREILRSLLVNFPTVRKFSFLFYAIKPITQTNYPQLRCEYLKALRTIDENSHT